VLPAGPSSEDVRSPYAMIGAPPTKANASVPDLAPFRGLRYTRGPDLSLVTAPPYDVIDPDDHAALEEADPHNSVRLILPRAEGGDDAYATAARTLREWRRDDVLRADDAPALYPYRMIAPRGDGGTHTTVGVIGALALPDDGHGGGVLPHERTLPKARSDRLSLLRATRANLDPIWALTLAVGLTELLEPFEVVESAVDAQGVRHEIGVVDDPERIAAIRALVVSADAVLADGHHRFETACNYRREASGDDRQGADAIMCLVVELDDAQLDVRPFHRIIEQPPADLRERLTGAFAVRDAGPVTPDTIAAVLREMADTAAMGLVDATGVAILDPKLEALEQALTDVPACLHGVDAARFDAAIRPHLDGAALRYKAGVRAVENIEADEAAVLLRGVDVDQIRAAAAERVLMPEKTTYFAPKPRTGMVMRSLDD
jgi:uncharacterized protein (DUF1015 family)